jgi:hypothetical protein
MSRFAGLGLEVETPSRLELEHPVTHQPLRNAETGEAAWIDLLSGESSVAKAHERASLDKAFKRPGRKMTAEEFLADQVERLVKLTKGWSLMTLDGRPLDVPFTPAAARELYSLPELSWIREQAAQFVGELGHFAETPLNN